MTGAVVLDEPFASVMLEERVPCFRFLADMAADPDHRADPNALGAGIRNANPPCIPICFLDHTKFESASAFSR